MAGLDKSGRFGILQIAADFFVMEIHLNTSTKLSYRFNFLTLISPSITLYTFENHRFNLMASKEFWQTTRQLSYTRALSVIIPVTQFLGDIEKDRRNSET